VDGVIFAQLWHVGRVSHTALQPDGAAPVSASAVATDRVSVFIETAPAPVNWYRLRHRAH
jgi:N-ethylmaleimide reductase